LRVAWFGVVGLIAGSAGMPVKATAPSECMVLLFRNATSDAKFA
jgi:hypothetical protein